MTLIFGHCRLQREETARTSLLVVDLKKQQQQQQQNDRQQTGL